MDPLVDDVSLGGDDDVLFRRKMRRSLLDVELEEESDEMECPVVEASDLWRLRIEVGLVGVIDPASLVDDRDELRERDWVSFDRELMLEAVEKVRLPAL